MKAVASSARRERILDAARTLIREPGDAGFSMRALAERAGVSIATPYNLFGSKQSILVAVLDADLEEYRRELSELHADAVEVLFRAVGLLSELLQREPDFYRNAMRAVIREGPELRLMVGGPRYRVWKGLLRQAADAGLLRTDVDPDAFAVASSQLILANVTEWAHGALSLEEMAARNEYGLALALSAIATARSRAQLERRMRAAEAKLQRHWRAMLLERLRDGDLDEETRVLLADQLDQLTPDQEAS